MHNRYEELIQRFLLYSLILVMLLTNDSASSVLSIPVANFHILVKDILLYPLLLMCILAAFKNKRFKTGLFWIQVALILSVYYLFILWGISNGNSWKHIFHNLRQVNFLLIYFPLIAYLDKEEPENLLLFCVKIILASSILTCALSYYFYGFSINGSIPINVRTEFFWIDSPSHLQIYRILMAASTYFPVTIITLLCMTPHLKSRERRYCILISVIVSIALLLTFSRSLWLAMGICTIAAFFLLDLSWPAKFKIVQIFAVFFVCFLVLISLLKASLLLDVKERFMSIFDMNMMANFERLDEAKVFLDKIREKPLLGYGQGASLELYVHSFGKRVVTTFSHNSYLIYLLNYGIIGTFLILSSFVFYFVKIRGVRLTGIDNAIKTGLNCGFIGLLTLSLVTSNITYTSGCFFLGLFFAVQSKLLERRNATSYTS